MNRRNLLATVAVAPFAAMPASASEAHQVEDRDAFLDMLLDTAHRTNVSLDLLEALTRGLDREGHETVLANVAEFRKSCGILAVPIRPEPVLEALKNERATTNALNEAEDRAHSCKRVEIPTAPFRPARYAITPEGIDKAIDEERLAAMYEGAEWKPRRANYDAAHEYFRNSPDPEPLKAELKRLQDASARAHKREKVEEHRQVQREAWQALLETRAETLEGVLAKLEEEKRSGDLEFLVESAFQDLQWLAKRYAVEPMGGTA